MLKVWLGNVASSKYLRCLISITNLCREIGNVRKFQLWYKRMWERKWNWISIVKQPADMHLDLSQKHPYHFLMYDYKNICSGIGGCKIDHAKNIFFESPDQDIFVYKGMCRILHYAVYNIHCLFVCTHDTPKGCLLWHTANQPLETAIHKKG